MSGDANGSKATKVDREEFTKKAGSWVCGGLLAGSAFLGWSIVYPITVAGVWAAIWHMNYWRASVANEEAPRVVVFLLLAISVAALYWHIDQQSVLNSIHRRCVTAWAQADHDPSHACADVLSMLEQVGTQ